MQEYSTKPNNHCELWSILFWDKPKKAIKPLC